MDDFFRRIGKEALEELYKHYKPIIALANTKPIVYVAINSATTNFITNVHLMGVYNEQK